MFTGKIVDQVEAERRSKVCAACPNNVFPEDKNAFMAWSDEIAYNSVGDKKVSNAKELGHCQGCSCLLKAKVFYQPPFSLSPRESKQMRAANKNCWQLPENEQKDRIDI